MKHVIHIFGASGSGTSTLGRAICHEMGYTFMDTDDYFWLPTDPKYTVKRPVQERLDRIRADIFHADNVVLSGSLSGWGDPLIPLFTLAIRLETDTDIRVERLRCRERKAFGDRIDAGGDMHQAHEAFIAWAKQYDNGDMNMRSKAMHDAWQTQLQCPLLRLNGGDSISGNVEAVRLAL